MHEMVELVINSFNWRHDRMAVELPRDFVSDDQLLDQLLVIMQNKGDLARSLRDAMRDGSISPQEYTQLDRDVMTCILALLKLRKKIHVKHVTDQ